MLQKAALSNPTGSCELPLTPQSSTEEQVGPSVDHFSGAGAVLPAVVPPAFTALD